MYSFKSTFYTQVPDESIRYFSYRVSSSTRNKGGGYRHRKHQHRYIAPEFNYTAKYWALVSETTPPPANLTKQSKCTLKDGQSEDVAKVCVFDYNLRKQVSVFDDLLLFNDNL